MRPRERFGVSRFDWLVRGVLPLALMAVTAGCQPRMGHEASRPEAHVDSTALIVDAGTAFTWARDGRAELYRIELFDQAGALLSGAVTADTTVPADAVLPDTSRAGTWRVVSVTAGGTELEPGPRRGFRRR